MGPTLSYMNIVSIRNCVMLKEKDLFAILAEHEGRPVRYVQYLPPPNMEVVKMLMDEHFPKNKSKKKEEDYNSEEDEENDWYWEDVPEEEARAGGVGSGGGDDEGDEEEEFGGKVAFQEPAKKARRRKAVPGPYSSTPSTTAAAASDNNNSYKNKNNSNNNGGNNNKSSSNIISLDDEKDEKEGGKEYIGELVVSSKPQKSKFAEKIQTIPEVAKSMEIVAVPEPPPKPVYKMHISKFNEILQKPNLMIERSDADILCTLWKLNDKMGFGDGDVRMCLVAVCVIVCDDAKHCVDLAFRLYDTTEDQLFDKSDFLIIMKLLNEACLYFGDRYLPTSQIVDLVDSIYTSAGRIDGELYYPDHVDAISSHPLMELYLSPQFQGNIRLKSFAEEDIHTMNVVVRI